MIRVLEVNVDDNGYGGVYSLVLNIIKNISSQYQIDICAFESFESRKNIDEVEKYGGKVYYCGHKGNVFSKQFTCMLNLRNLVKKNKYNTIHIHSDVSYKLLLYSFFAKLGGAKKVIIHSHATSIDGKHRTIKKILQMATRPFVGCFADEFLACSELAGKWMYPLRYRRTSHYEVVNNGININQFTFTPEVRNRVRKALGVEDAFVVGHIGRFAYQKNHNLLLDIFNEILQMKPTAKLLLIGGYVGDDSYLKQAKEKVKKFGIENQVLFLGIRKDVPELMQAMDCFLLPSRFEGLPIVGVEAQAAGLPSFFSTNITEETKITNLAYFISDEDSVKLWAETVIMITKKNIRANQYEKIEKAGFDAKKVIKIIEGLYS